MNIYRIVEWSHSAECNNDRGTYSCLEYAEREYTLMAATIEEDSELSLYEERLNPCPIPSALMIARIKLDTEKYIATNVAAREIRERMARIP